MLKEAHQAYLFQRIASDPVSVTASQMLYLATLAGAQAIGLEHQTGDFAAGKAADLVYLRPPENSVLSSVIKAADQPERVLAALFALAGEESVREVRIAGERVFTNPVKQ